LASIAHSISQGGVDEPFFRRSAILMALVIVAGFSTQYLMGRSTFEARPLVHFHGIAFMTWVGLFVTQSWLATRGPIALHRQLGWIGAGWIAVLLVMAFLIVIDVAQRGLTPFFFRPQHFLIANPLTAVVFAALAWAAIRMRKSTDWHMRLHIGAMVAIIGPGFGRLLPMPLLIPYAFEIAGLVSMLFILAGMIRDWRKMGKVHAAWWWGLIANLAVIPVSSMIANSPMGDAIYASVTKGHPGAVQPGLTFPTPPPVAG
jgi:hypothetical protein